MEYIIARRDTVPSSISVTFGYWPHPFNCEAEFAEHRRNTDHGARKNNRRCVGNAAMTGLRVGAGCSSAPNQNRHNETLIREFRLRHNRIIKSPSFRNEISLIVASRPCSARLDGITLEQRVSRMSTAIPLEVCNIVRQAGAQHSCHSEHLNAG